MGRLGVAVYALIGLMLAIFETSKSFIRKQGAWYTKQKALY
jgi:hypothetical protein